MDRRIIGFLVLAFGFSWAVGGMGYALGIRSAADPWYAVMGALCMLGPAFAAIVQQRLIDKEPWSGLGLRFMDTRWRFLWLTVLLGLVMMPLALGLMALFGNVLGADAFGQVSVTSARFMVAIQELTAEQGLPSPPEGLAILEAIPGWVILVLIQLAALIGAFTANVPFMLGEELGWRGYLWQRVAAWKGVQRVLFTGIVWGLWHAPLIAIGHNYPGYPVAGIGMMVVLCLLFGLLFDWSRMRSGTVWSSVLLHGLINGSAGSFLFFASNGHPLVGSPVGLAGFVAFALLGVLVLLLDRTYRSDFLNGPSPGP